MRRFVLTILLSFFSSYLFAQELFPLNEPASTVPKGVIGVRLESENYKEYSLIRNMNMIRLMYGVTSNLSVYVSASESNHHSVDTFPPNLASHTHPPKGAPPVYSTGNIARGVPYPTVLSGIDVYAKYRFLTLDGHKQHLRMAVYGEWSNVNVVHDEAEPTLIDDTKGYGGGLITTYLKNHLAISLTAGGIIPGEYDGESHDLLGGPLVPTNLQYGKALLYNLSFGYLLFPHQYKTYEQSNFSVYLEFEGKSYQAAKITQYEVIPVPISTPLLEAASYVDAYPGVQWIYKSNLRVELSAGFPLINQSYVHFYPVFWLGVQRYFFPPHKKLKKEAQ